MWNIYFRRESYDCRFARWHLTKKTENKYIKDGAITKQYYAQVQVQMYCAKVNKSYFCVASSGFEKDNKVNIIEIAYDQIYVSELLHSVISFWKRNIFLILYFI